MILADKIIEERKKNGWSQEELAERLSVSRQSVSKWEGAQAVPDLGKIIRMADIFGVTIDYLVRDEIESKAFSNPDEPSASEPLLIKVSMEEACGFLEAEEKAAPWMALASSLFILSPVSVVFLLGLSAGNLITLTKDAAVALGMILFFSFVAVGILITIRTEANRKRFKYIESKAIDTEYGVAGMVKKRREENRGRHMAKIFIGAALCVLGVVSLVAGSFFGDGASMLLLTALLLVMVAAGVNLAMRATIIALSYSKLLQEDDYTVKKKENAPLISKISGVYWLIVLAVYLGWSLISEDWHRTWVIWVVACVLFSAVILIIKLIIKDED